MDILFNCFKDICNPFEEDELIVLGTGETIIPEIKSSLGNLLEMNEGATIKLLYVKDKKKKKKNLLSLLI